MADEPNLERTAVRLGVAPGQLLDGKWELLDKLGEGGMGAVYLARDVALDRMVAVKMLLNAQLATPELLARFEREARTMAKLDHPNLVTVHAVGNKDGLPFIVMKHLEGCSLGQLISQRAAAQQTLSPTEFLSIAKQLCAGLAYLHEQGFVHRDVKPGNVFVGSDGRVTILDLGIARPRQSQLTQTGLVIGSPMYMAPEQITGADDLDARADIYAMGVVLFEMLTGQPPFEAPSDFQLMQRHFVEPPPDPALLNPSLPAGVGDALRRAMAKHRDERFPNATELYAALEAAFAGVPEPQAPHRLGTRPLPAGSMPTPATGQLLVAAIRPSLAPLVAAGALLLVAGALFAAWSLLHTSVEQPQPVVIAPPPIAVAPTAPAPTPPAPTAPSPTAPAPTAPAPTAAPTAQPSPQPPKPVDPKPLPAAAPASDERAAVDKRSGKIQVTVTLEGKLSWGWVDLDGLRRGVTPVTLDAAPGPRVLRISRPGFRDVEREVAVKPGALHKVVVALEPR